MSTTDPSATQPAARATVPSGFTLAGKQEGTSEAPASLLQVIRVGRHARHDRVVFEFAGAVPAYDVRYVDEVHEDPSDRPVDLEGQAFLLVVMPGGTLNTTPQVTDPAQARSYDGPREMHPDLAVVEEIAAAGDFEAVLSFGLGLEQQAPFRVLRLTDPARIVVDVATG